MGSQGNVDGAAPEGGVFQIDVGAPGVGPAWVVVVVHQLITNVGGETHALLVLGERLLWRFSVILGLPHLERPGTGESHPIGHILLDAVTGAVEQPEALAEALQTHASSAH